MSKFFSAAYLNICPLFESQVKAQQLVYAERVWR